MPDSATTPGTHGYEPDASRPLRASLRLICAAAATLGLELLLMGSVARGLSGVWPAFGLHVAAGAGLSAAAARRHRAGEDARLHILLAVTTLGCGPFGALGSLAIALSATRREAASQPFQEWYESLFPEHEESLSERVYDRVKSQLDDEDGEPASFADLVRFGSLAEKQAVLALVGKRFKPSFAPVLELALQDPTNAVRVQAATAIAIVESRFAEAIQDLTERLAAGGERSEDLLALARLYDDYAFTGLLDPERESSNRDKALECYQRYLVAQPDDRDTKLALGRLLLRSRRYKEASLWLSGVIGTEEPTPQLALWYMECLFHLRRFDELRQWASRYAAEVDSRADTLPPVAIGALSLWGARDPEAAA